MNRTPLDCLVDMIDRATRLEPGARILRAVLAPETDGRSWTWSLTVETTYGPIQEYKADSTRRHIRMLTAVFLLADRYGYGQAEVYPTDSGRYRTLRFGSRTSGYDPDQGVTDLEEAIREIYRGLVEEADRDA